ncbi:MAG: RusA family crossover junction endodeoxyribonuclease [Bacteroidota bacterium]
MAKGTQFSLDGFKKNPDGSYSKISNPQPRENWVEKHALPLKKPEIKDEPGQKVSIKYDAFEGYDASRFTDIYKNTGNIILTEPVNNLTTITLTLFGIPMPKQSVRAYVKGDNTLGHFQPEKHGIRTDDYIRQIKKQLPEGFKMFEQICHITKMHFVYPPLKSFHKKKGTMERIRNGEIIYKNTRPDLPDNLKKLVNDSMSNLVYKDDGIIVTENDVAKYYGVGGCIIIELKGR